MLPGKEKSRLSLKASNICKCLPWFYPNNLTTLPICDMFGAKCFDMIMSDDTYYQNCTSQCLDDCNSTSYMIIPSYEPINIEETCNLKKFKEFFQIVYEEHKEFERFEEMTDKNWKKKFFLYHSEKICNDHLPKYIAMVSIESPTRTVTKSNKVKRITIYEQLAIIGGTLGLFTGMSILSMVEVVCFCVNMIKKSCMSARKTLWTSRMPI